MLSVTLPLLLLLTAPVHGILPDIVDSGINHIVGDVFSRGQADVDSRLVKEEQLQQKPESQLNDSVTPPPPSHLPSNTNDTTSNHIEPVHDSTLDTNITSTTDRPNYLDNNIYHDCITDDDCGKGGYCPSPPAHRSKCMSCKALDVPCTRDVECCDEHIMCVWGQCTQSTSKGDAGSTCQTQSDCNPELCCAFHKALLFPICLSKPIEREQCFSASNQLMELFYGGPEDEGPRKHCPCLGDLHCQHLGRGSMCLKGEDSSEEDMTDNLYSEIDYII
ncbi:dickkopf-related protein 3a isoform X2 [Eucyclogobius newberryi]|uniref:dickkopf-related protein 3a isoform X2 n=1 Tax=Eucyclogobius newberryi TaxID=166745 RepID=UPI003B59CFEB